MNYKIKFLDAASRDALKLRHEEPKSFAKLMRMVDELKEHPTTGTGKPEYLKYEANNAETQTCLQDLP